MDILLLLKAALMGIVEGLTEFLPISSTGHLILTSALLNFAAPPFSREKAHAFEIAIQTGAIFAVILVYWQKIRRTVVSLPHSRQSQRFALNVIMAFLPAVVLGLLFGQAIKENLFTPVVVAVTFILGGFVIIWAEKRQKTARVLSVETMSLGDAIKARTPTQRDADRRLFLSQLPEGIARADFERHGWMSPLNIERIAAFWEDMSPGLFDG